MKLALFLAAVSLAGCADASDLPADPRATLDPISFFTGRSHGEASLHKIMSSDVHVSVDSVGRPDGHGGLILDQTIREGAKPKRQRRWVMQPVSANRFTGTLTDAVGPVDVMIAGPRVNIRYRMKSGLIVEQQLALQSDGSTVLNVLIVKKFGVRVARLTETIRKLD
ncbi:MAG: DUF3833 family protein [Sphingomicrobium sp.]